MQGENKPFLHSLPRAMPSAPFLVAMAMPPRLPSFPFFPFLPVALRPPRPVPPALLALLGRPAVLPGPPVLVVPLSPLAVVGGGAASLPAFPVPVPVAPMAPVAVPLLRLPALHVAQRRAAHAALHAGLRQLARLAGVGPDGFLMLIVVVAVVVGGAAAVVDVLATVLLVQRQLARLGLVGVVVAVVLRVHHKRTVQVGLHIAASFLWVRHLSQGSKCDEWAVLNPDIHLKGSTYP